MPIKPLVTTFVVVFVVTYFISTKVLYRYNKSKRMKGKRKK